MNQQKYYVKENLSEAWFKAFEHIYRKGNTFPLIVSVENIPENINEIENNNIRNELDDFLKERGCSSVRTVANTIFPWSLWNPNKDRVKLYKRHFSITPSISTCIPNYDGHYFRRMISYNVKYDGTVYESDKYINQLDHIIETWKKGNHRHTALQIGIFDPARDHNDSRRKGFPCLHQVSIDPFGRNGKDGLGITAFYPSQLLIKKAYGNYLGLCRLGYFMAHEMDLQFVKMTCVISKASIDENAFKKSDRDELFENVSTIIK